MRYADEYFDWADAADERLSPHDRERAALTAAKIRDNASSSFDRQQVERMERIARGGRSADREDDDVRRPKAATAPHRIAVESRTLTFDLEGTEVVIDMLPEGVNAERLEFLAYEAISTMGAFRDIAIAGFEGTPTLSKAGVFRARVRIGDMGDEAESSTRDRLVVIEGRLHQPVSSGAEGKPQHARRPGPRPVR